MASTIPLIRPPAASSNGLNMPDIISEYLGAEPTLPYLSPDLRGEKLLIGANFASAGIGILNDTGIQFDHKTIGVLPAASTEIEFLGWS
ncbi:hypothetical protein J5N97_024297 [Dioscorea zingiberensis]|uniref:Uncharacterized protein n=1 Tax=Dioscorea zingiberensis TaxID=325984 RepID=A0A9D5H8P4_9LILI|nr:hypothetical protein J5N97_024297 [Dioscorea zingiberensis]